MGIRDRVVVRVKLNGIGQHVPGIRRKQNSYPSKTQIQTSHESNTAINEAELLVVGKVQGDVVLEPVDPF